MPSAFRKRFCWWVNGSMEYRQQLADMGFRDEQVVEAVLQRGRDRGASLHDIVEWILERESAGRSQSRSDSERKDHDLGGLDSVFRREKQKLDEFWCLVEDGLRSVEALSVLAGEIELRTRSLVDRKRLNGETEDDIVDDMLSRSQVAGGCLDVPASTDPRTHAQQIGQVIAPCMRSSYGVLSLSEAYRIYNRSRIRDIATPDEFVRACGEFEAAGVPLRLERGAVFSSGSDAEDVMKRVLTVITKSQNGSSSVDVSSEADMPVGVSALYLGRAESRALVVRDDTSRGVYYHVNKFMTFDCV